LLDFGARLGGITLGQLQFDELALSHLLDSRKAESCQRMLDRLALGIEHTILQRNMHARLHFACYLHTSPGGGGRLALKAPPFNVPISSGSLFRLLVPLHLERRGQMVLPRDKALPLAKIRKTLSSLLQAGLSMSLYPSALLNPRIPLHSWWEESASVPPLACPPLEEDAACDVIVIGGGYTGLSAALHLQRHHHLSVRLLEAGQPGAGASGRNGGFCCIGGAKLSYSAMLRRFGEEETRRFFTVQREAIETVEALAEEGLANLGARGQPGEVCLAHRPGRAASLQLEGEVLRRTFGIAAEWKSPERLAEEGMKSSLHGGLFLPLGFGLHPLDYARSLARAALQHGVKLHGESEAIAWSREGKYQRVRTPRGSLRAERVILATNGYSRENLIPAQAGRLLPVLSNILVTRKLSEEELQAQGWNSTRLAYDSRDLLHYFRLLPDGRFLF